MCAFGSGIMRTAERGGPVISFARAPRTRIESNIQV